MLVTLAAVVDMTAPLISVVVDHTSSKVIVCGGSTIVVGDGTGRVSNYIPVWILNLEVLTLHRRQNKRARRIAADDWIWVVVNGRVDEDRPRATIAASRACA